MAAVPVSRFLDPAVLARLGSFELIARTVVDGVLTGLHRSPDFGFSQEFAEYRAYNEGDDLRFVDWNVYARADRMYIKRFRGETNTALTLLLDISASMAFGEPTSKLDQARYLVASLAYLARKQQDSIGMVVFDDAVRDQAAPSARPDSLLRLFGMLERTNVGTGTDIGDALSSLRLNMSKRGLLVLVSDLYTDPETLAHGLQPLAYAGQDIAVFHVLDQQELSPDVKKISELTSLESGKSVVVDPEFLRNGYRTAIQQHCEQMEQTCLRAGADYMRILTNEPLDDAITRYLQFRERRAQ